MTNRRGICLVGYVQDQGFYTSGPDAIRDHAAYIARTIGRGTHYIATPTCTPFAYPPPEHTVEQPVALPSLKPGQDPLDGGPQFVDNSLVAAVSQEVLHEFDPDQREVGDDLQLALARRGATEDDAVTAARVSPLAQSLAGQAEIAGHHVTDERLQARIADVLQLLVIGAILVMLVGAQPNRLEIVMRLGAAAWPS